MAGVHGLGHVNLRAGPELIERLRRFYIDIVGLEEGPRPTFRSGSRGHWLYAGDIDVMHLSIDEHGDNTPTSTGHLNHLAFACTDLDATHERLAQAQIPYTSDRVDQLGQVQLFLTDPAGLHIELNFTRHQ